MYSQKCYCLASLFPKQIHECRNWESDRTSSFLGTHKSGFRYSAGQYNGFLILHNIFEKGDIVTRVFPLDEQNLSDQSF